MNTRLLTLAALATLPLGLSLEAQARPRPRARVRPAKLLEVITPLGRQGATGSGANVTIPFRVRDRAFS